MRPVDELDGDALFVPPLNASVTKPVDSLGSFLRQLGCLTVRIAELETALDMANRSAVIVGMRVLSIEWSILDASLNHLRRIAPSGLEAVTIPAMKIARDSARRAISESLIYVASAARDDASETEMVMGLYLLAERVMQPAPFDEERAEAPAATEPGQAVAIDASRMAPSYRVVPLHARSSCVTSVLIGRAARDGASSRRRAGGRHG